MAKKLQQHDQREEPWEDCPSGVLSRMVEQVDSVESRRRRKQIYGTALLSTALFAGLVFAVGSFLSPGSPHYGGITCSECHSHFAGYRSQLTEGVSMEDDALASSMKTHLEKCANCRDMFNSLYPGVLTTEFTPATRPVETLRLRPLLAVSRQGTFF